MEHEFSIKMHFTNPKWLTKHANFIFIYFRQNTLLFFGFLHCFLKSFIQRLIVVSDGEPIVG